MSEPASPAIVRWSVTRSVWWPRILFVLVVWAIAGAFLMVNALSQGALAMYRELTLGVSPGAPSTAATRASTSADPCNATLTEWVRSHPFAPDSRVSALAPEIAFIMGFDVGRVAGPVAIGRSTAEQTPRSLERVGRMTEVLHSPMPVLPAVGHQLQAFNEVTAYIERDPQCVAACLARMFSPRHAALYRFGQAVGFSTYMRIVPPESGTSMSDDIARYGRLSELPPTLWLPLAKQSKTPLPGERPQAQLEAVDRGVGRRLIAPSAHIEPPRSPCRGFHADSATPQLDA